VEARKKVGVVGRHGLTLVGWASVGLLLLKRLEMGLLLARLAHAEVGWRRDRAVRFRLVTVVTFLVRVFRELRVRLASPLDLRELLTVGHCAAAPAAVGDAKALALRELGAALVLATAPSTVGDAEPAALRELVAARVAAARAASVGLAEAARLRKLFAPVVLAPRAVAVAARTHCSEPTQRVLAGKSCNGDYGGS
jgi:hypothetical protein